MGDKQFQAWNHFVPRFVLKRFESTSGIIKEYRIVVSHASVREWSDVAISTAAARKHLYTVQAQPDLSDELEKWFTRTFEDPASRALTRVAERQLLGKSDKLALGRFFGLQDLRTPVAYLKGKEHFRKKGKVELDSSMQELVTKLSAPPSAGASRPAGSVRDNRLFQMKVSVKPVDEETALIKAKIVYGRNMWMWGIRTILSDSSALKALSSHEWTILTAPAGQAWVTCDNPAVKLGMDGPRLHANGGWGTAGHILFMPISPRHLLFTQNGMSVPRPYTVVTNARFNLFQRLIAQNAYRYIYAAAPDNAISTLRPRLVDAKLFNADKDQWAEWHADNLAVAKALDES